MIIIYINIIECRLISTIVFIDLLFMRKHFILFSQYMCIHLPLIFLYRIEFRHLKFILLNEILQVIITLHIIILYKRHFIGLDTLRLVKGRKKSAVFFLENIIFHPFGSLGIFLFHLPRHHGIILLLQ